ncbi:MAG: hypothetical protein FWD76_02445 [Firmicutes bacterium]|nr:hypothetical protein [Bacillota bacterium]
MSTPPIKLFIFGFSGKMGTAIRTSLPQGFQVIGGLSQKGVHILDTHNPLLSLCSQKKGSFGLHPIHQLTQLLQKNTPDIFLDFSSPVLLDRLLDTALLFQKPLLIATTGYTQKAKAKIKCSAKKIPILLAPNLSWGICILTQIAKQVQNALPNSEIVILEKHHNQKKDRPSGTAKAIKSALKNNNPHTQPHTLSIRGGNTPGTHELYFYDGDETIVLTHTALSRTIYTNGTQKAISYLLSHPPALYTMNDICH